MENNYIFTKNISTYLYVIGLMVTHALGHMMYCYRLLVPMN